MHIRNQIDPSQPKSTFKPTYHTLFRNHMDKQPITAITRRQLRDMIATRSPRKDGDGQALYILRRALRSLELFCTPDTIGGDLAHEICMAIDELDPVANDHGPVERLISHHDNERPQ